MTSFFGFVFVGRIKTSLAKDSRDITFERNFECHGWKQAKTLNLDKEQVLAARTTGRHRRGAVAPNVGQNKALKTLEINNSCTA